MLSAVAPLRALPYAEQLALKQATALEALQLIAQGLLSSAEARALPAAAGKRQREAGAGAGAGAGAEEAQLPLPPELSWLRPRMAELGGQACLLANIVGAPGGPSAYRNKAEFSCGLSAQKEPCVGFRVGGFQSACRDYVESSAAYPHLPWELCAAAQATSAFLRSSPLQPYCLVAKTGVWRQLLVRCATGSPSSSEGTVLVELMAKPPSPGSRELPVYEAEVLRWSSAMAELRQQGHAGGGGGGGGSQLVCSTWLQEYSGVSAPAVAAVQRRLLAGRGWLVDSYSTVDLNFRVSPGAFAQVNTQAASEMYRLVRALALEGMRGARALLGSAVPSGRRAVAAAAGAAAAGAAAGASAAAAAESSQQPLAAGLLPSVQRSLAVLDVCCGGGLVGLTCARFCGLVLGVDLAPESIEDAQANAQLNGFAVEGSSSSSSSSSAAAEQSSAGSPARLRFVCDRAENAISALLSAAFKSPELGITHAVAVVNPPRGGLHHTVIKALRTSKGLSRIVYVSCNSKTLVLDAIKLCAPENFFNKFTAARGAPFLPVVAVPLDLAPHTRGVEIIMLLERP
jgi:tRNA (uracil-5-)-methyltransferase